MSRRVTRNTLRTEEFRDSRVRAARGAPIHKWEKYSVPQTIVGSDAKISLEILGCESGVGSSYRREHHGAMWRVDGL